MKATGGENGYFRRWAGQHATTLEEQQRLGVPSAALAVVAPTLATLNSALILLIGGLRAVEGHISVGLLVAFQALVTRFTAPLTRLNGGGGPHPGLRRGRGPAEGRGELPRRPALLPARAAPRAPAGCTGHVTLESITFGYSPLDKPLLTGFSLSVGPGSRSRWSAAPAAASPPSPGCISGLYSPWEGVIRIDGQRLEDISARRAGRLGLLRRPGRLPLRGHRPRQRGAVGPVHPGRRGGRGAAGRGAVRRRRAPPRRHPQPRRAGRPQLLRRPAPASGDRPGAGAPAQHPGARRGDQRAGRARPSRSSSTTCGGAAAPAW